MAPEAASASCPVVQSAFLFPAATSANLDTADYRQRAAPKAAAAHQVQDTASCRQKAAAATASRLVRAPSTGPDPASAAQRPQSEKPLALAASHHRSETPPARLAAPPDHSLEHLETLVAVPHSPQSRCAARPKTAPAGSLSERPADWPRSSRPARQAALWPPALAGTTDHRPAAAGPPCHPGPSTSARRAYT